MYIINLSIAGTGVNKILGGEDSATHYMDGTCILMQLFKDFRKIMLFMIGIKDNNRKLRDSSSLTGKG